MASVTYRLTAEDWDQLWNPMSMKLPLVITSIIWPTEQQAYIRQDFRRSRKATQHTDGLNRCPSDAARRQRSTFH